MKKIFLGILIFVGIPTGGSAASLILASQGGWNGFAIEATIRSGFREAGGPGEVATTDSGFLSVVPDVHPPGTTLTMTSSTSGLSQLEVNSLPDTGDSKDGAQGALSLGFTIGTATTDDSFFFSLDSTTSAVTAMVDFGSGAVPADAFFEARVRLLTFAPATIPGAVLRLPDLPELTSPSTETMLATIDSYLGGSPFAGFMAPGDAGIVLPIELIDFTESLEYDFQYSIVTPHGTDPTIDYSFAGSSAVPEPGSGVLALLGVVLLGRRRR